MRPVLVLNGPNLGRLGSREPDVYGTVDFEGLAELCRATSGAPASVCGASIVRDYGVRLARFGGRGAGCPVRWPRAASFRRRPPRG